MPSLSNVLSPMLRGAAAAALLAASLGAASPPPVAAAASAGIDVVASNWKFTPAHIEAHVGQKTTLNLTSSEGVHGLASTDLAIAQTTIAPGKAVKVEFTPKKAGSYDIHCSIVCGAGHEKMVLTIKVVP